MPRWGMGIFTRGSGGCARVRDGRTIPNANGVPSISPGLARQRLPWVRGERAQNPERVSSRSRMTAPLQPFQGCEKFSRWTQGSTSGATLGWMMERRWRSCAARSEFHQHREIFFAALESFAFSVRGFFGGSWCRAKGAKGAKERAGERNRNPRRLSNHAGTFSFFFLRVLRVLRATKILRALRV